MNTCIAIPSYRRVDRLLSDKVNTLDYIPNELKGQVYIFVRPEELEEYKLVQNRYGVHLETLHDIRPGFGMPDSRDRILDFARRNNMDKIIMMDDDLKLAVHVLESHKTLYTPMTKEDFKEMVIRLFEQISKDIPLVGISPRQFSNNRKEEIYYNTAITQVMGLHMGTVLKNEWTFNYGMPYASDHCFNLKVLTSGHKNCILNKYTKDDIPNEDGGCSVERTATLHSKSMVAIYKMFPRYVRLVQKRNGAWKEPRINAVFSWKKAYKENSHGV